MLCAMCKCILDDDDDIFCDDCIAEEILTPKELLSQSLKRNINNDNT